MGSRYGGLKQIDPVGPAGETVLDYAVFDAIRAGFGRVVFVIRREFFDAFQASVSSKYAGRIAVDFVFQSTDQLPGGYEAPAGRTKPWGTGHAVWCARESVLTAFAVINADDFYGASSFRRLATFLSEAPEERFAIVGFRLGNTLSENGTVSRGICTARDGALVSIVEETAIARKDVGAGLRFSGDELVSMNCWGFSPRVFSGLDGALRQFLDERIGDPKAEFYLPAAVSGMIASGFARVDVLASDDRWFGVTYREDKDAVAAAVAALVASGAYPARLFG